MTTLYLIRHAEAEGNIERRFQGHYNGKISENGEKQLRYLKKRFRKIHLDAVYTSPLSRAVATAEAVNYYAELPLVLDAALMEICGGGFEGKKYAEIPKLFPEEWEHWDREPHKFKAPGGETMRQCYDRMKAIMHRILHGNMGNTVAVVSHGCTLRNYLCYLTDTPFECLDEVPWGDNTCVTRVDFDDRFKHKIIYMNDTSHLPEELSTLAKQNWWRKDGSKEEEPEEENKRIAIESGELYIEESHMEIERGDLLLPQGPAPLSNVKLHIGSGTVYVRDGNLKLTKPPKGHERLVKLEDSDEDFSQEQDLSEQEKAELADASKEELQPLESSGSEDEFVETEFEKVSV